MKIIILVAYLSCILLSFKKDRTGLNESISSSNVAVNASSRSLTNSGDHNGTVSDIDGNTYKTVQIGTQLWMAENLRTTKYQNGTPIPNVTDNAKWKKLTTGAWCYYNNDAANNTLYGKLYNWYAVKNTNRLCPKGWHVPTNAEWNKLLKFLEPSADTTLCCNNQAGNKMKTKGIQYWQSPNQKATNSSGFSGLPGGARNLNGSTFNYMGQTGYWWSETETITKSGYGRFLFYLNGTLTRFNGVKSDGFCVRCLKD